MSTRLLQIIMDKIIKYQFTKDDNSLENSSPNKLK